MKKLALASVAITGLMALGVVLHFWMMKRELRDALADL
jgi:hypothetical protein